MPLSAGFAHRIAFYLDAGGENSSPVGEDAVGQGCGSADLLKATKRDRQF